MKKNLSYITFVLGFCILVFIFLIVSIASIVFLLGGGISKWWLPLSLAISSGGLYYLLELRGCARSYIWVGAFLTIVAASVLFGNSTIDSTFDGNSYHKTAIGALKNGWNPVSNDINSFNKSEKNPHKIIDRFGDDRVNDAPWANSYPKASWIFAATIYKATGNIESGKALNLLMMVAVFLIALSYLRLRLNQYGSAVISALAALNPVAVSQVFGYFIDGAMGGLIIILLILATCLLDKKVKLTIPSYLVYGALFITITIISNMKFTGLAYAGLTMMCYWVYLFISKEWHTLKLVTTVGVTSLIFAVSVVGASSYVKNAILYGNPLYPLVGKNSIDIMSHNQPASYSSKSGLHKFIKSNLSPTGNNSYDSSLKIAEAPIKTPFTISIEELKVLGNDPDLRQAGYGVWFGGILIFSFLSGLYLLARYGRRYSSELALFVLPVVSILVIVIAFDNTWWARYLPQLCIVPLLILSALFSLHKRVMGCVLMFMLMFNVTLTALLSMDYQHKYVSALNYNLDAQLRCSGKPIRIYGEGYLSGAMYNLWDRCDKVIPISQEKIKNFDKDKFTRLITDIYAVR